MINDIAAPCSPKLPLPGAALRGRTGFTWRAWRDNSEETSTKNKLILDYQILTGLMLIVWDV